MAEEYSSPIAREAARIIRLADASSFAGSMGKFLAGLGVCVGAGIGLAILLTIICYSLFGRNPPGLTGWFWIYVLVLVPLIVWYERNYRTNYLMEAGLAANSKPASIGEDRLTQVGIMTGAISSILTWGPRSLVDGLRNLIGKRTVAQSAVIDRSVLLVLDLNASTGRVDIKKLIHPPEDMQIFAQSVDMLDALDLIGKSKEGDSLWLSSTFRQKLFDFTKTAPSA